MEIKPILLTLKRNKFMSLLMVVQIAFTMGVLSSSIFVAMATLAQWNMPSGIPQDDIIRVSPRIYDEQKEVNQLLASDLKRLRQFPGVEAVSPSSAVPFTAENLVRVYTQTEEDAKPYLSVIFDGEDNLMEVLELELIEGRRFTAADVIRDTNIQNAEVMISVDMAQVLFGEQSAVGKTFYLGPQGSDAVKVVGVYANFMTGERLNGRGKSYQSILRARSVWDADSEPHYLIRMAPGTAENKLEDVMDLFYQEGGRYIDYYERLKRTQKRMYDGRGSRALTFLVISGVLVLITAFGVTGLTSFQVNQKRKQIGTRRALGARKSDIMRYFLLENSVISLLGLVIGIVLTFSITFEISSDAAQNYLNVGAMLATAAGLWIINLLAVWWPARRAANVPPAIVTRSA